MGEDEVDMVACDLARDDVQFMLHRDLPDEVAHTDGGGTSPRDSRALRCRSPLRP